MLTWAHRENFRLYGSVTRGYTAGGFNTDAASLTALTTPFNPETVIPFSLATPGRVAVRVYDVRGRLVRTVMDAVKPAGIHAARWNGSTQSGQRSAEVANYTRAEE